MAAQSHSKCAKCGITSKEDSSLTFHRFPLPSKHGSLKARVWATFCFPNGDWMSDGSLQNLYKQHKMLCGKHFDDTSFTSSDRKRLNKFAIPSEAQNILAYLRDEQHNSRKETHDVQKPAGEVEIEVTTERRVVRVNNGDGTGATNETPQSKDNNDKNATSELRNRRISCDTTDTLKSSEIYEDPLATELDEVADHTVSDSESYLEDIDEEISEWSDGIIDEYAEKWESILKNGLVKSVQDEINSNYLFCKNLPSSKPPTLNTEIANLLTEEIKTRDNELVNKQSQLGHALAALGKAMIGLRTNTMETSDILETLSDVGELIADLHYLETEARRNLIVQEVDKSFAEPLKDQVRDEYLFGQDVGELVKRPEVKTTASSITPRMISTFLNRKKMKSRAALIPVHRNTKTLQRFMKRRTAPTPVYQITKKPRQSIEKSSTTLRIPEEDLSINMDTAAPDPDQTTTDPTAALTVSQLNYIQIYDENCQPLLPPQEPTTSLTKDIDLLEGDREDRKLIYKFFKIKRGSLIRHTTPRTGYKL